MKTPHLFKQALLITAVSSLAFTNVAFAMNEETEKKTITPIKPTPTLHEQWEDAKKNTASFEKLFEIIQKGCNSAFTEKKDLNFVEHAIWMARLEKLEKRQSTTGLNYNALEDDKQDTQLWNKYYNLKELEEKLTEPLSLPNNNSPKIEENLKEKQPEVQPQVFVLDDQKNDIISIVPQKTSKDLWMEDSINNPKKRFNFVINVLWSLYEKGLLPPVAEMKSKGTSSFTLEGVKMTVDLSDFNKKISKLVGKDEYMYKKAIEEIDRVFNKKLNLDIENLPSPIMQKGNKLVAKAWSENWKLESNFNWSTLSSYYQTLGSSSKSRFTNVCVIKQIINKINSGELEYK